MLKTSKDFAVKSFLIGLVDDSNPPPFSPLNRIWTAEVPAMAEFLAWLIARRKVNTNNMIQRKFYFAFLPLGGVSQTKEMLNA